MNEMDRGDMPLTEHVHAGRIRAVALLSAAHAMAECACDALEEEGIRSPNDVGGGVNEARAALRAAADEVAEPLRLSQIIDTLEELIVSRGPAKVDLAVREHLLYGVLRARDEADADEVS